MIQYEFPNGKYANKENESNDKRNDVTKPSCSGGESKFDWAEKQAIHQQRKLRLIQVRQQSKEIASQIRENVRHEERRQMEKINRLKQDELFNWRQKQIESTEKDYKHCLSQIGQAHTAAERENEKQRLIAEQHERNRKLALKRGKIASEKLKNPPKMKTTKQTITNATKQSKNVEKSPIIISSSEPSPSSASDSSVASVIMVDSKKKPVKKVHIKSKSPLRDASPKLKSPTKTKSPIKIMEYYPMRYASACNSSATDISTDSPPPFITKISDLLGVKPTKPTTLRSSPHIAKTYKLDKSPVSSRCTTKRVVQKSKINTVSTRLSRTIQTPTKISGKSPIKVLPERKHFVPEFVKPKPIYKTYKDSVVQTTPQRTSKVQFYDHANKFSKQYDGSIELEERILNITPLSAWDEAKRNAAQEPDDCSKLLSMLTENRAKVALEKEKIRKDYERMSSQLNEILKNNELANSFVQTNDILSESRLKQIAEEKQQLMNKNFRGVLKAPAVITCPKVKTQTKSNPISTQHRPKSGDINVSQMKSRADEASSSDSTHSFLLDYMTERTNNLCDDISRCRQNKNEKSQSKIDALHELLGKVNSFRRILCDEIKQNNGDISRIDASQFITEIEKVEEKQQEIMQGKSTAKANKMAADKTDANQKREQYLKERERQLKIKESCINEKARELYLREKKIGQQKEQSNKVMVKQICKENGVANGKNAAKSVEIAETLDDVPMRIVINVNKNEQTREQYTDVVVNDVKWSEKLSTKSNTKSNQHVQCVPVTSEAGKIYPKTPAKAKVVTMERKQTDVSSQSSTSFTAYLSPPELLKTHLSELLEKSGSLAKSSARLNDSHQISDNELLNYIIRLLGMSRASIDQLDMSSITTVKTPNSSVINASSNIPSNISLQSTPISHLSSISCQQLQSIDKAKLQQLARYLAENNQLGTNARKNSKESGSSGIWDDILSKKTEPTSKSERTETEQTKSNKMAKRKEDDPAANDPDEKLSRDDLIAKYDELAASCTKRIINLDSMISKVREEKQKLLENTLSSASSLITGQKETTTTTEYKSYPQPEPNQQTQPNGNNMGSPLSDSKGTNAPSSEFSSTSGTGETSMPNHDAGLFGTAKPLAESKDSGVGNSRPVTSSDYRESPDLNLKANSKPTEQDNGGKLLQHALRETRREYNFEPLLKDIPKPTFMHSTDNVRRQEHDPTAAGGRDKTKQAPPVAMTRYSPHMEDELPHELSTITEVDTPATSRLNATDMANLNETTLKNKTVKSTTLGAEANKLAYNAFPNFHDYIKSNPNFSQVSMSSVNDTIDSTTQTIPDEKLSKMLEPQGSKANELVYKKYEGDVEQLQLDNTLLGRDSDLHLAYSKFPTHAEYAKAVPGLLDSQSIDQIQGEEATENSNSSLPDIVNELKNRNILDRSFGEASDDDCDQTDDLLKIRRKNESSVTTECHNDEVFKSLENDLIEMGLSWVNSELKKCKSDSTTTSTSSNSSSRAEQLNRFAGKPPIKRTAKRTFQNFDQSHPTGDSFVDKSLLPVKTATVRTQPSDTDANEPKINLKEFLARELLKHSSMSSSSDSSMASIFLKSFLGRSSPDTPQSRGLNNQQRTSTPVDNSKTASKSGDASNSRASVHGSRDINKVGGASNTFFSNDSPHLSSVRLSSTESTSTSTSTNTDERHK